MRFRYLLELPREVMAPEAAFRAERSASSDFFASSQMACVRHARCWSQTVCIGETYKRASASKQEVSTEPARTVFCPLSCIFSAGTIDQ